MTGESGAGIRGAAGVRGAPQDAGRKALERGDRAHSTRQTRSPRRPGLLASRLPSGCKGSPQPSKTSSSASSRLQLASSRLWSSAASIAPRSGARRGSVTARPAWLPGAGFESERPRERRVLAPLAQPRPANSLPALRSNVGSCQVWTLAERSRRTHPAAGPPARSRPMAAPGGGAGRLLSAGPRLPPPAHQSNPESAFSGSHQVPRRAAGMDSVGLRWRNDLPEGRALGAGKRARPPKELASCFFSLSEDTGGDDRGSGEPTSRSAL